LFTSADATAGSSELAAAPRTARRVNAIRGSLAPPRAFHAAHPG
jgi:hypothetical protein